MKAYHSIKPSLVAPVWHKPVLEQRMQHILSGFPVKTKSVWRIDPDRPAPDHAVDKCTDIEAPPGYLIVDEVNLPSPALRMVCRPHPDVNAGRHGRRHKSVVVPVDSPLDGVDVIRIQLLGVLRRVKIVAHQ